LVEDGASASDATDAAGETGEEGDVTTGYGFAPEPDTGTLSATGVTLLVEATGDGAWENGKPRTGRTVGGGGKDEAAGGGTASCAHIKCAASIAMHAAKKPRIQTDALVYFCLFITDLFSLQTSFL
jgi:hypothetical protein